MKNIKSSNFLSPEAMNYFTDMFDPMKGLNLPTLKVQKQIRFKNGVNCVGLFPLNLNSSVLKFMMMQMYTRDFVFDGPSAPPLENKE